MGLKYRTIEQYSDFFWSKFIRKGMHGCLIWTGKSINSYGYASVAIPSILRHATDKKFIKIARMAWYLERGYWSEQNILHHCDVRLCCELDHLYEGSQRDNMLDRAGRPDYTQSNWVSADTKVQIRAAYARGCTYRQLSVDHSLSESTIWKIVTRKYK